MHITAISHPISDTVLLTVNVNGKKSAFNRKEAYSLLFSDLGIKVRINRSIMAEENFAQIKSNPGHMRA